MAKSSNNKFKKLSSDIGTPSHIDFIKATDDRRHKARCIYYDKSDKKCHCSGCCTYLLKCVGSAHCIGYREKDWYPTKY